MKRRAIAIVAVLAILFVFGIRLAHPYGGLSSAMGSAESGIVIYKKGTTVAKGDKIVISVENLVDPKKTRHTYLGTVITSDDNGVGVDAKDIITQINPEDIDSSIKGKMIVVIPFFGKLFSIIGL